MKLRASRAVYFNFVFNSSVYFSVIQFKTLFGEMGWRSPQQQKAWIKPLYAATT